jgi:hypothetical protein
MEKKTRKKLNGFAKAHFVGQHTAPNVHKRMVFQVAVAAELASRQMLRASIPRT